MDVDALPSDDRSPDARPDVPPVTRREGALVLFQAGVMFLALTAWNPHPCLFDDNVSQWLPVTDQGISDLLSGELPIWNPYLLNGIRVDLVGYYGFANPIMIAAHLLARTGVSNTISLYIALTFLIGSLFAHLLARRLGSDWRRSCLLVAMYQMSVTFWCHCHWHYIFNNFMMCPAILWGVHRFLDAENVGDMRARAWQLGGLLGLAVGLGNIQYALSQWILAAGVLIPPLAVEAFTAKARVRRDLAGLVRVGAAALLIALPTLWMTQSAGKFPLGIFRECSSWALSPWAAFGHNLRLDGVWDFAGPDGNPGDACRVGGLALVACGTLLALLRRPSRATVNALACLGVLACFLTFASGRIVDWLPVLNKFRYAFKWWFLVPPLALELACLTPRLTPRLEPRLMPMSPRRRSLDAALLALGLAWGVFDVISLYPLGRNPPNWDQVFYDVRGFAELRERLDLDNYRLVPVIAGPDDQLIAADAHASQRFGGDYLSANVPAYLKAYSATGYHVGFDNDQVQAICEITGQEAFFYGVPLDLRDPPECMPLEHIDKSLASVTDAEAASLLAGRALSDNRVLHPGGWVSDPAGMRFWSVQRGTLRITREFQPRLTGLRDRFREAGIRYLIALDRDVEKAIAKLEAAEPGEKHPWNVIRGPRYSAIEIPGAKPLVTDGDGQAIRFVPRGNGVTAFVGPRSVETDVAVRFNFARSFRAVATAGDGRRQTLSVTREPGGMMRISLPAGDWQRLDVRMNDYRVLAALFANLLACGLIAGAMIRRRARVMASEIRRPTLLQFSRPPLSRAA